MEEEEEEEEFLRSRAEHVVEPYFSIDLSRSIDKKNAIWEKES